ncbi:MAG TPA: TIGR03435 family protein [Methylococcaceae bacterium]|nr:TIGR03435 family protein [Methylococcaceae bacterium]
MKNYLGRALWTTVLAALSIGVLLAQDMVGTWQGSLKNAKNGKELRLVGKISRAANEKLAATFYSIDQGGQPINAGAVTQQGTNIKIDIPAIGGTYEGKLSEDSNALTGTWTQGQPAPLNLVRATPETAWAIPEPPPPPKIMAANVDPSFEVATIKPANPERPGLSILVNGTGMLNTTNTSLKDLMIFAYGVHPGQIQNLPSWAEDEKYDITGKPDHEGVGNDVQIRSMMRKLLAERFSLTFHRENKELSAFTLNVGKDGPKLTVNESGGNLPGFGGRGPGSIGVRNSTMAQFAGFLQARIVDRPVVDKTGLAGKYDFTLTWRPDQLGPTPPNAPPPPADIESRPDIFGAMQEQLGLRFQAERTPVEVLVIDKVAKPSDN